jgi:hypothetical protein
MRAWATSDFFPATQKGCRDFRPLSATSPWKRPLTMWLSSFTSCGFTPTARMAHAGSSWLQRIERHWAGETGRLCRRNSRTTAKIKSRPSPNRGPRRPTQMGRRRPPTSSRPRMLMGTLLSGCPYPGVGQRAACDGYRMARCRAPMVRAGDRKLSGTQRTATGHMTMAAVGALIGIPKPADKL